jgi:hypothetical protein
VIEKPQRLCKDCKHLRPTGWEWFTCIPAPCDIKTDPMNGGPGAFPLVERMHPAFGPNCGTEGSLWEAK